MTDTRAPSFFTVLRPWLLAVALTPLLACGGDEGNEDAPEIDCAATPAPKYSEMSAVWAKCTTCHSSTLGAGSRANAPEGIDFNTYADAKAEAALAMHEVYEGAMPPAGLPALTEDEEQQLYRWASCGTPE
ncbi:hypothetical protein [Nannocystis radixulma]|uniref:Cytochrome c domain-containing protein n=1 Tax=Nannocystis radixulma TaxID=2995305 RepID=A0ABT5BLX7_9BACT|nr:hypothetical protein [Nannocystis radixulma]MDC0674658.1 hypothetical protein [Nannocystis radixulma]